MPAPLAATPTRPAAERAPAPAIRSLGSCALQRCGPRPCSCSAQERERHARRPPAGAGLHRAARSPAMPLDEPDWALVRRPLGEPGRPLEAAVAARLGARLGHDFSGVRVHDDAAAAASTRAVDAEAFTVGHHLVFDRGRYAPGSATGERLLAHELTHVVQQAGQPIPAGPLPITAPDAPSEREAGTAGTTAWGGSAAALPGGAGTADRAGGRLGAIAVARQPNPRTICESRANSPTPRPGDCWSREPENCVAYEDWIASFTLLRTFAARTTPTRMSRPSGPHTFAVIGGGPARRYGGPSTERAPSQPSGSQRLGEAFIDHPTDEWVRQCLPANLRATAYQLPSDCADIAVILRHVWLAAHRRTERFGGFVIGDRAGEAAQARIGSVISRVGSGDVAAMVNPYSDPSGRPLRTFSDLEPLLHVGDVLVWAHFDKPGGYRAPRSGGHTHTISRVDRDTMGHIRSIGVLQGNLPIFGTAGQPGDDKGDIIRHLGRPDTAALREALGVAPGRRIEAARLTSTDLSDNHVPLGPNGLDVWEWHPGTILVAAGPPRAAPRPASQRRAGGGRQPRRLTDWIPSLANATGDTLVGAWEATLLEARRLEEGGQPTSSTDARRIGEAAGERLWRLATGAARRSGDLGQVTHFGRLREMDGLLAGIRAGANPAARQRVRLVLGEIEDAFVTAARGGTDLAFRGSPGGSALRFLLTGFDPFRGDLRQPLPGAWNPSAAAVLSLDGASVAVPGPGSTRVRLESLVLPVDFDEFRAGIVERLVGLGGSVDAVLTVSQGAHTTDPTGALRIERYAVGTRNDPRPGRGLGPVPAAPGGSLGPAIIESPAPVAALAARATTRPRHGTAAGQPMVGEAITFEFADVPSSIAAQRALGLAAQASARVAISDEAAVRRIISRMRRLSNGVDIEFSAGGRTFRARVLAGPGGAFLSNEVSYRVLRAAAGGGTTSFHIHTPTGAPLPDGRPAPGSPSRADAVATARRLVAHVVDGLRRIIAATARHILDRRAPARHRP